MVKSCPELVSGPEHALIETIQALQYGELYGVQVDAEDRWVDCEVSPAMRDLLGYIRDGAQHIDILTVHNGQPTLAETDLLLNGFRCRKKVKFPS